MAARKHADGEAAGGFAGPRFQMVATDVRIIGAAVGSNGNIERSLLGVDIAPIQRCIRPKWWYHEPQEVRVLAHIGGHPLQAVEFPQQFIVGRFGEWHMAEAEAAGRARPIRKCAAGKDRLCRRSHRVNSKRDCRAHAMAEEREAADPSTAAGPRRSRRPGAPSAGREPPTAGSPGRAVARGKPPRPGGNASAQLRKADVPPPADGKQNRRIAASARDRHAGNQGSVTLASAVFLRRRRASRRRLSGESDSRMDCGDAGAGADTRPSGGPQDVLQVTLEGDDAQSLDVGERSLSREPGQLIVVGPVCQQPAQGLAPWPDVLLGHLGNGHHLLVNLVAVVPDGTHGQAGSPPPAWLRGCHRRRRRARGRRAASPPE